MFHARDSILDSDFRHLILSPSTLKSQIFNKHLETVEEKHGSKNSSLSYSQNPSLTN